MNRDQNKSISQNAPWPVTKIRFDEVKLTLGRNHNKGILQNSPWLLTKVRLEYAEYRRGKVNFEPKSQKNEYSPDHPLATDEG